MPIELFAQGAEPEEGVESDLLAADPATDPVEEEAAEAHAEAAEEPDEDALLPAEPAKKGKGLGQTAPFQRIIGQRDKARGEAAEARTKLDAAQPFQSAVTEVYGRHADPLGMMRWDAQFMDAWERLSHQDPALAEAAQRVKQAMATGQLPAQEAQQRPAAAAQAPRDERVDAIVTREATRDMEATLREAGFNEARIAGLAKSIVSRAKDPLNIEREQIREGVARYMQEHGFTRADMAAAKARTTGARPPARGARSVPAAQAAEESEETAPAAAPDKDTFLRNRETLKRAAMRRFAQ